jgi:hypothetical protein
VRHASFANTRPRESDRLIAVGPPSTIRLHDELCDRRVRDDRKTIVKEDYARVARSRTPQRCAARWKSGRDP